MKEISKIEDITDKDIERYIRLQDFVIGRNFIALTVTTMAVSFMFLNHLGTGLVGLVLFVGRFILYPIFTNLMAPITRKHDPEGYRQFLDFKKREYFTKYYKN